MTGMSEPYAAAQVSRLKKEAAVLKRWTGRLPREKRDGAEA